MAEEIRQMLLPNSKPVSSASGSATNSEAELLLRRAEVFSKRYGQKLEQVDFDLAYSDLKRALELDPKLADAAAGIAWLNLDKGLTDGNETLITEAERWMNRALEIDEHCGRAWAALSNKEAYSLRPDKKKWLDFALKAVRDSPRDPKSLSALGNAPIPIALGLAPAKEAYRLNPLDLENASMVGETLFQLGRTAEGLPYLDGILNIEPDYIFVLYWKVLMLADLGRVDEAASLLPKVQRALGPDSTPATLWLPLVLALERGDSTEADRLLKEILSKINDPNTPAHMVGGAALQLPPFLVRHGRIKAALDILGRCLEIEMFPLYDMLVLDPRLEPLRRDARFQPILDKYRENGMENMRVLAQARDRGELPSFLEAPFADLLEKLDIKL
jgi:tetratricopeptide (TPR) repeat protein